MAIPRNNRELKKDTVYIDVDDEITTIIEKLNNSTEKLVALVLPKRASVLQSTVNMKLLKRSADNAGKRLVLITSEAGLLPLAGLVGLHVASSLQSKPAIPPSPDQVPREQVVDEDTGETYEDFDTDAAADQPVGKLAGLGAAGAAGAAGTAAAGATAKPATAATGAAAAAGYSSNFRTANKFTEPETIELDDDPADSPDDDGNQTRTVTPAIAAAAAAAPKKGKDKKLKIPNFNKFRIILVSAVVLLLLLGGGFIYANSALSKAVVTVKTNSTDIATKADLTIDPKATEADLASDTLPAKVETKTQNGSQQVATSGQKNNGTKASGTVTLSLTNCNVDEVSVPAGTGVSANGQTFITQAGVTLQSVKVGSTCRNSDFRNISTQDVTVVSQSTGASYNIPESKFAVAGFANVSGQSAAAFTGGTDNIIKVVAQADIDSAKSKLTTTDSAAVKSELAAKLKADGYIALPASLHTGDPTITPSAAVGDAADTITVTSATIYTMYGVKQADIKSIVTANVKDQIDTSKQEILEDGVSKAKYDIAATTAGGPLQVTLTASSVAGPNIKVDTIKQQLAGKKTGEVQSILRAIPGVTSVDVSYSPFWVSKVPSKTDKIELVIVKASGETTSVSGGSGSAN